MEQFDLFVVGGGINGAGIARDAAGRGLSVAIAEMGDFASATSQWSSKLIHGGLRYLEYYEFRLVAESLRERERLLQLAPHLIQPLAVLVPHEPHLRPAWMIRAGLYLYDFLGGKKSVPRSTSVSLEGTPYGAGLQTRLKQGFLYWDARVDDARLVIANVKSAAALGAQIYATTRVTHVVRTAQGWRVELKNVLTGETSAVYARGLVNATGPWVKETQDLIALDPQSPVKKAGVRHVKGSHIIVPRIHAGEHALLLQNADKRIIFVIPYQHDFTLIGTTDVTVAEYEKPQITPDEVSYLCGIASQYLAKRVTAADVISTYSGVRPLYDDGKVNASAVTRDYVLRLDDGRTTQHPNFPLLSVFGGKLTTYRELALHALQRLEKFYPQMKPEWTHSAALPGGNLGTANLAEFVATLKGEYGYLTTIHLERIAARHGSETRAVLGNAKSREELGIYHGGGLYEREVRWLVEREWARTAEDVLWRRTKAGLFMSSARIQAFTEQFKP